MRVSAFLVATMPLASGAYLAAADPPTTISDVIEVSAEDLSSREVVFDEDGYEVLDFSGGSHYYDPAVEGHPDLPVLRLRYLLPPGMKVASVTVDATEGGTVAGLFQPLPVQGPDLPGGSEFVPPDEEIYGSEEAYPERLVRLESVGAMRGFMLANIVVYPAEYVGASGRITFYERLSLEIQLEVLGEADAVRAPRGWGAGQVLSRHQRDWLVEAVRNPEALDHYDPADDIVEARGSVVDSLAYGGATVTEFPSFDSPVVDYVLVTSEALEDAFQPLVNWKTEKGVLATLRTTEWIDANYAGVDTQERIRNFLIEAYEEWGTRWVLLGGDANVVPPRYFWHQWQIYGQAPRDVYYSGLDGTWNKDHDFRFGESTQDIDTADPYADVWLGRVPARTAEEAETFVDKLFAYVRHPVAGGSDPADAFYSRFLAFAGMTLRDDWPSDRNGLFKAYKIGTGAVERAQLDSKVLLEHIWDSSITSGCFGDAQTNLAAAHTAGDVEPWTGSALRTALNDGYGLVYHAEHSFTYQEGGASACEDSDFCGISESCRDDLMVVSAASGADDPLLDEEVYRLSSGNGAYSVVFSWGSYVNAHDMGSVSEQWIRSPEGGAIAYIGYTRSGYTSSFYAYSDTTFFHTVLDDGVHQVGEAFALTMAGTGNPLQSSLVHSLLGDPEMAVWTAAPDTFDVPAVSPSPFTVLGPQSVTITIESANSAVEDARVCIMQSDDAYAVGYTDASGEVTFYDFDVRQSAPVAVTVTKDGYKPRQRSVSFFGLGGAFVRYDGHTATEDPSASNEDDVIGAGEDIELDVEVRNVGSSATGSNVVVDLIVNEPFSLDLLTHDTSFPIQIGASDAEYVESEDGAMWFPANHAGVRAEGEPSGLGSQDGIFLWRDMDDAGTWNLVTSAGTGTRSGEARSPGNTIVKWKVEVPDGYPVPHSVTTHDFEGSDLVSVTASGLLITLVDDSGGGANHDTVRFVLDEADWITVVDGTDTIGAGISGGGTAIADFELSLSPEIPDDHRALFTVRATVSGSEVGVSDFGVDLAAPELALLDLGLEPVNGDTFLVAPVVSNPGSGQADTVRVAIAAADPNVTILTGSAFTTGLAGGGSPTSVGPLTFIVDTGQVGLDDALLDLDLSVVFERGAVGDTLATSFVDLELDAPAAPEDVEAWTVENGKFRVRWEVLEESGTDVTRYNVYRAPITSGTYTRVNDVLVENTTSFDVPGTPGVSGFKFKVAAVDSCHNEGAWSDSVVVGAPGYAFLDGWPKYVPVAGEASMPIVVDADDDGTLEIFVATDKVYAWEVNGDPDDGADANGVLFDPGGDGTNFWTALAAADMDNNDGGKYEIVAAGEDTLYVLEHDGTLKFKKPVWSRITPPTIADLDDDGDQEVLIVTGNASGKIYAWHHDGSSVIAANADGTFANVPAHFNYGSLSVANMTALPDLEVIYAPGSGGVLRVFRPYDGDADDLADELWNYDTGVTTRMWKPAIADVDDDSVNEIIVAQGQGVAGTSRIHVFRADSTKTREKVFGEGGTAFTNAIGTSTGFGPAVAIGNLDDDDALEIVVGGRDQGTEVLADTTSVPIFVVDYTSVVALVYEVEVPHYSPYHKHNEDVDYAIASPMIANIDDDEEMEIMIGTQQTAFHFVEWDATNQVLVPDETVPLLLLSGEVDGTGQIGNFDNDDAYELLVFDRGGQILLMDLTTDTEEQSIEWAMFGADLGRTGRYAPVTSIAGPSDDPTVLTSGLRGNRPNPFNPQTTFQYAVGTPSRVSLEVFDVRGRHLATLLSEELQEVGEYEVRWDGRDASGVELGSGVYFYRLTVGDEVFSSKMLMVR